MSDVWAWFQIVSAIFFFAAAFYSAWVEEWARGCFYLILLVNILHK